MEHLATLPERGLDQAPELILILGILSIVCCFITGIVAWVMGNADLQAMAAGQMDPTGEGMTKAGKICGMVGVGIAVISILVYGAIFLEETVTAVSIDAAWSTSVHATLLGDNTPIRKLEHDDKVRFWRPIR